MKKRIALAAVAALAGGLLVAAPASAIFAPTPFGLTNATGVTGNGTATVAGTQVAGAANYASIYAASTGVTFTSGTLEGYLTITGGTFTATGLSGATLDTALTTATITADSVTAVNVNVATPAVGTITVKFITRQWVSGVATDTIQQTVTITVQASATGTVYNHTTLSAWGYSGYVDSKGNLFQYKNTVNVPVSVAGFTISQWSSSDDSQALLPANAKAVTVAISGPGLIQYGMNAPTTYLAFSGLSSQAITVYSDGRAGVSTITVAVDGKTVGTKTLTFYGDVASYTLTIDKANIGAWGDGDCGYITGIAKDANGVGVPNAPTYWSADSATIAYLDYSSPRWTSTSGDTLGTFNNYICSETNNYGGDVNVTVADNATLASAVVKSVIKAHFVKPGVSTVTLTLDKATYVPGEKATLTITGKNPDGVAVADGTLYIFTSGITTSTGVTTNLSSNSVVFKNGIATYSVYMPVIQGPVVFSAALGNDDYVGTVGATVSVSTAVVDAAAAAQAAAIIALQTSIATLTTTVASLVASMTAQIKVINATMLRIQKAIAKLQKLLKK